MRFYNLFRAFVCENPELGSSATKYASKRTMRALLMNVTGVTEVINRAAWGRGAVLVLHVVFFLFVCFF